MAAGHRRAGHEQGNPQADLNAVQREAQAFTLRAQGYEFAEIAQQCGYTNASGAYKAYKRALARIPKRAVDEMRETILAAQHYALRHLAARISKGDTFAVREMTLIHDRMAKLFGLDIQPEAAGAQNVTRQYVGVDVEAA